MHPSQATQLTPLQARRYVLIRVIVYLGFPLLFLALCEGGLRLGFRLGHGYPFGTKVSGRWGALSVYQDSAGQRAWRDWIALADTRYVPLPYVMYGSRANLTLPTVHTDARGFRVSRGPAWDRPSADVSGDRLVAVLGGSTVWGTGATSDSTTIPSLLQRALEESGPGRFAVVNAGESGYLGTQHYLQLVLRVAPVRRPGVVVVYAGANEAYAGLVPGLAPGEPGEWTVWRERLAGDPGRRLVAGLSDWLGGSLALSYYLGKLVPTRAKPVEIAATRADSIGTAFESSMGLIADWCEAKQAHCLFVLQPILATTAKPLTREEAEILKREFARPGTRESIGRIYDSLRGALVRLKARHPRAGVLDLTSAFDTDSSLVFIDKVHVWDAGNRIVASELARAVRNLVTP